MKKLTGFHLFSLFLTLTITLFAVTPAFADTHHQFVVPIDNYFNWLGSENPCGFDILYHEWGYIRLNYWLDENEQVTHVQEIYGRMRNENIANGKSISSNIQGPIHYEFTANTVTMTMLGTAGLLTIPGHGVVQGWAGQLIRTFTINPVTGEWENETVLKSVGNTDYWDYWDEYCEYLSP